MIAKAIHHNSPRKDRPFIRVNCGALTGTLLESEMFGHVKGPSPARYATRSAGLKPRTAGTIFLDEIGTLEPQLQVKLLRVLQEREFERVGDTQTLKVDVRVIAATNVDLQEEVAKQMFREDLFYRLNVVTDVSAAVTQSARGYSPADRPFPRQIQRALTTASSAASAGKCSMCCCDIRGPAMSGNWKTQSSGRWYSAETKTSPKTCFR